ncbi:maleylpyruvate isomerase family mycothiol-dependent enzyme [Skermania piniformis]|uniref:Maleylpyruvate isomerase family mycothiol-dependent enzyme n=1 Tax=Skermania pinensis TaxID=39122 RepID=A0ABX8SAA5_9ACTN|nr:maleylpyruvate isomerase family mycothiol-dependent enzyme [Skermania piniformis]QXQ14713.1 maleylpyruvate isomerase family mycothiol-dependent enzyme [Skermania piniformis]
MTDNQAAVTDALLETWDTLDTRLTALPAADWRTPTALPGWSVHDVVSHIVGTESMLSGAPLPACDIDVRSLDHVRNEIAVLNEYWVSALRELTAAELTSRFRTITGRRREFLTGLDAAAWAAPTPSPIGETSYGRFMRIRLFDCWMHEHDIADAVGWTVDEGGRRGELAIDEITDALAYLIGKRGKAPDGARVTLELTGPVERTYHVAVEGRARIVDALDGPATTTIRLDSRLFTRLAGGRTDADRHPDEIEFAGDTALGEHLVRRLAFTI